MKTTSYKVFYILFQFTFFMLVLGSILMLTNSLIALFNDDEHHYSVGAFAQYELNIDSKVMDLKNVSSEVMDSHLDSEQASVKFKTKDRSVKLFMTSLLVSKILYLFSILFVVRKFALSLKRDQLFNIKNARFLKLLGILVLLRIPLEYVYRYIVGEWIDRHFMMDSLYAVVPGSAGYKTGYTLGVIAGGGNSFSLGWALMGLLILVIAEVFRQGLIMKEEQDLTI